MTTLNIFFYYAILTISYNIVLGYTGLFSFCHVSFGAIGGYTSALLAANAGLSPFLTVIVPVLWARPPAVSLLASSFSESAAFTCAWSPGLSEWSWKMF